MSALFDPSPDRAKKIDTQLRTELAGSLNYLAGYLAAESWDNSASLAETLATLRAGPTSPWTFGLYATLAQKASNGALDAAREGFDLLVNEVSTPSKSGFIPLSSTVLPDCLLGVANTLFDTDHTRTFLPRSPSLEDTNRCRAELTSALELIEKTDPDFFAEIQILLRLFLLAAPAGTSAVENFNGASTFFLWGASLFNATLSRSVIEAIDVIVHEASHLLLFGLVSGGAVSENDPELLLYSPLRSDPRPIDGIFHAAFVSTRVHLAMTRMKSSGRIPSELLPGLERSLDANKLGALESIGVLQKELKPTEAGREIFDALAEYWRIPLSIQA